MGIPPNRNSRINHWHELFGSRFACVKPTIYQYGKFVDKVGYQTLRNWLQNWTTDGQIDLGILTVARTQAYFQDNFNAVSSLGTPPSRASGRPRTSACCKAQEIQQ